MAGGLFAAVTGGRIGPSSTTTSGVAISEETIQIVPQRRAWFGSVTVAYSTSMNPSMYPNVCIGPPNPEIVPAAQGTKHCQR